MSPDLIVAAHWRSISTFAALGASGIAVARVTVFLLNRLTVAASPYPTPLPALPPPSNPLSLPGQFLPVGFMAGDVLDGDEPNNNHSQSH